LGQIWNYAVVHTLSPDRAGLYVKKISAFLGRDSAYVTEVSAVIGAHSGIGALAIAAMQE
jgi:fatty acid-binding protein DegV